MRLGRIHNGLVFGSSKNQKIFKRKDNEKNDNFYKSYGRAQGTVDSSDIWKKKCLQNDVINEKEYETFCILFIEDVNEKNE